MFAQERNLQKSKNKVRFIGQKTSYTDLRNEISVWEVLPVEFNIQFVRGHVEVYDGAGRFLFSADTEGEALAELAAA